MMLSSGCLENARRFRRGRGGSVAIIFSLALPLIIGATALAVDIANLYMRRTELQAGADSAALAAAKQLYMAGANFDVIHSIAESFALAISCNTSFGGWSGGTLAHQTRQRLSCRPRSNGGPSASKGYSIPVMFVSEMYAACRTSHS